MKQAALLLVWAALLAWVWWMGSPPGSAPPPTPQARVKWRRGRLRLKNRRGTTVRNSEV